MKYRVTRTLEDEIEAENDYEAQRKAERMREGDFIYKATYIEEAE